MNTFRNSPITADVISTVRLTPSPMNNSVLAYSIPPPPINTNNFYQSNIILLNIDWSRVPPYKKYKKA